MTDLLAVAQEIAYSDAVESPADFRFLMECRFPEIGLDQIKALWVQVTS